MDDSKSRSRSRSRSPVVKVVEEIHSEGNSAPIYLHLIFSKFQFEISSLMNWNFAGYTGSKYHVQTGKKIKFIKLDISNWKIVKIDCK